MKILKKKAAFTLIELIVVLVIMALLAAMAIPVMMGYVKQARETMDLTDIGFLNRITKAYYTAHYVKTGPIGVGGDIFKDFTTNEARQQALIDDGLMTEKLKSRITGGLFEWSVENQVWGNGTGGTGGGAETPPPLHYTGLITDDLLGLNTGKYNKNTVYNYGDLVEYTDGSGKTMYYKFTGSRSQTAENPSSIYANYWKAVQLELIVGNIYEKGDIVQYNNKFYWAKHEAGVIYTYNLGNAAKTLSECFLEVEQSGKNWYFVASGALAKEIK